jgi:uncharacterized protein
VPARRRAGPVLGVDLAGSPRRTTGCCLLVAGAPARCSVVHTDDELRDLVRAVRPALIIVDAPLSIPRGRSTIEDRNGPHLRECDRELLRHHIPFFPITLGPMRMLTERGMRLATEFRTAGYEVVEGYPGASQDLLGIPRKSAGLPAVRRGLRRLGLRWERSAPGLTHDELDAMTIAWVGREHLGGRSWVIGDPHEGTMVLPRRRNGPRPRSTRTSRRAARVRQRAL